MAPHWKLDGGMRNSPSFPWYVIGRDLEFQMIFVNDTEASWHHCYLFVAENDVGRVFMKLPGDTEYSLVSRICDPEGFIGELMPGETTIDFKIVSLDGDRGVRYFGIPIYVGHDDGVFLPNRMFGTTWECSELWATCWANAELWWSNWKKSCGPCPLDPIPDGPWATEWTPVWIDGWNPVWSDEIV